MEVVKTMLLTIFALSVLFAIGHLSELIEEAREEYRQEGKCIEYHISLGIERRDIVAYAGKCEVVHGND